MTVQVIHTLSKPYDRLYAGIYIQIPEYGLIDKSNGRYYRNIQEVIDVKDNPNDVISRCIDKIFKRTPEVELITYVGPRSRADIERGEPLEKIKEIISNA